MNKKIFYISLLIAMLFVIPLFQSNAITSPEDISNLNTQKVEGSEDSTSIVPNQTYNYNDSKIEIIELNAQNTIVILNETYTLKLHHNNTYFEVNCTKVDVSSPHTLLEQEVFDIAYSISNESRILSLDLPDMDVEISQLKNETDNWSIEINELIEINVDTSQPHVEYIDSKYNIEFSNESIMIGDLFNENNTFIITNLADNQWLISCFTGLFFIDYNEPLNNLLIDWVMNFIVYGGPVPPPTIWPILPFFTIAFLDNGVIFEWAGVTIYIHMDMLILIVGYLTITWYFVFGTIERIVFIYFALTIILYITVTELIIVIIYDSYEIKIYEYQVVIIYESIEIIVLFISIFIWEITIILHAEFWFVQVIFLINLIKYVIVNPIRIVCVPVFIPVFIPLLYYIPVVIKNYVNIYVPFAAPEIFIKVYDEDLKNPTHTIQYLVYDNTNSPINDATVTVFYNNTFVLASFISNGIYEVLLPASTEKEHIRVVATKPWYPDGILDYDLNVTWVKETVTVQSPLPLIPIISSLVCIALAAVLLNKRKN